MCSETSSHRLSFSHDLSELEVVPIRDDEPGKDTLLQESNSEFEFSTSSSVLEFESSSADELFSNGVILPIQIQKRSITRKHTRYGETPYTKLPPRPCPSKVEKMREESIREVLDMNISDYKKKPQSKSFWGFCRSKSLNCDRRKSLICSLPLLSRSNSTGSVTNPKRASSKDAYKHKQASPSSSLSSSLNFYSLPKSHSGKSHGGSYGNGTVRISPVINVPTANLFGLGSFLSVGKTKKTKS